MKKLCLAAALAAICGGAQAQYHVTLVPLLGAGHGQVDCSRPATDCNKDNFGLKFLFGVDLNDHFAAEFTFIDFGRFRGSASPSVVPVAPGVPAEESLNAKAWGANIAYRYEFLPRLSAIGRLGLAYVRSHETGSTFNYKNEEHQLKPSYGAALGLALPWGWTAELGFDATDAKFGGNRARVQLYSLGAVLDF